MRDSHAQLIPSVGVLPAEKPRPNRSGLFVSIDRLRELFVLTDEGRLVNRIARRHSPVGSVAGTLDVSNGYRRVRVGGVRLKEHRVAFAMHHGHWPAGEVDHIDGDRQNNRPANLRDVSRAENGQNQRRPRKGSRSGLLGVIAHGNRWRAEIKSHGKTKNLGAFATPEEAHAAYLQAKREIHSTCSI